MAQATGYTVGAVATMIQDGLIRKGPVSMHDIDFLEIKRRVELMPNQFLVER